MTEAIHLTKSYGAIPAVDGASFTCGDGEITGLLGPNGAGKTTILRLLSTVLVPDRGTAVVDGHDLVTAPKRVRQAIGMLPDRVTSRQVV